MPPLFLTRHAHAVRIGDDLVLLDVAADRYLCLPGGAALGLAPDRRSLAACDVDLGDELIAAGLASRHPPATTLQPVPLAAARADLLRPAPGPITWADRRDLLRASYDAARVYPRRTFADLVAEAAARPPGRGPDRDPSEPMRELVARFHRWACWIPAPAKCLIRSFALLRHVRRHGCDARWVFAVRTWPFEAHCWLQAGGVILDDAPDRLVAYHPILVV